MTEDKTPAPVPHVVGADALRKAAEAGWNACRRQVYLLSEDYIDRTHPLKATDDTAGNFYRGQYDVAKSFAKAFNAFEAIDCDYFKQIDFAALAALPEPHLRDGATVADFANRLFNLHGFMLCEEYRGKPAVTITFPNLKEAQQFHGALVDLSRHKDRAALNYVREQFALSTEDSDRG